MDDDVTKNGTNKDDPRLGRFVPGNQNVFWHGGVRIVLQPGSDAGSWRPALIILALGLVIIATLTYILHLSDGLVYILLVVDGIIAALVWNQIFGHRH